MKKRASRTLHYSLTLSTSGAGTVTAGGVSLKTRLPAGTVVTVTATPNAGATFSAWSGGATGSANPLTVTMDGAKAITANFTPVSGQQFALQVTADDSAGHISGGGLDTTGTGSASANFASGTNVTLTATAKTGHNFANWTGALTGQVNPGSVVMDANKSVTAVFGVTQPPPTGLYPTSPFWDPIAASPAVDSNSTNFVNNFLGQGAWASKPQGTEFTANDWTRPFYVAKSTDPTHTIQGGMNGSYTEPSIQGDVIHVPAGARPAGGALSQQLDGSCVIQQPDGKVYSAWRSVDPIDGRANQWAMIDGNGDGIRKASGAPDTSIWRGGPMIGMPGNGGDLATADYEWFYNYTPTSGYSTSVPFVPMVYNAADVSSAPSGTSDEYLLTFNEPDAAGANQLTPTEALSHWPALMATGRQLGCPATTTGATTWRANFMNGAAAAGYRVDFMCVHWYGDFSNPANLRNYLNTVHANYGLPIWLTEFSAYNGTLAENTTFARNVGPLLADLPYLKRVGWFANRSIAGGAYANCGLVQAGGGALTTVGTAYKAWTRTIAGEQSGIGQAKLGPRIGQVTYDELVTAGVIKHALFMEVRNWNRRDWPGLLSGGGTGGHVADTNAPPMGGHFQLNYTPAEINALAVPAWKKVILRAMATYGLYTYDNGSSAHSLDWESGIPSILATGTNKWVTWAQSVGLPSHVDNTGHTIYTADIQSGVDWSRLRVLSPTGP